MKVVVVGGSAHSTPALFDAPQTFPGAFHFVLVGRNESRLQAVARAARLTAGLYGKAPALETAPSNQRADALSGADIVLVQIRVGGYAARAWDESFPHRYDVCGDEGLGPGGLAAAWRTWTEFERLLSQIDSVCPGALVLVMTAPLGILVNAAVAEFPQLHIVGICELPWTTLRKACAEAGCDARTATFAYAGVNHLGWFSAVSCAGRTIVGAEETLPLSYVRLHADRASTLRAQRHQPSRAAQLQRLADRAFAVYGNGTREEVVRTLRRRSTPWYSDAVTPFLRGIHSRASDVPFFLTARNGDAAPWFGSEAVIEHPYRISDGRLEPLTFTTPHPPSVHADVVRFVAYEAAAAKAIRTRERADLATALEVHPWLAGSAVSDALLADVTATDFATVSA